MYIYKVPVKVQAFPKCPLYSKEVMSQVRNYKHNLKQKTRKIYLLEQFSSSGRNWWKLDFCREGAELVLGCRVLGAMW